MIFLLRTKESELNNLYVPVLMALSYAFKPQSVLQIAPTQLSTSLFLNKVIFSELKKLTSVEIDEDIHSVNDGRHKLEQRMPVTFKEFDLIFIHGPKDTIRRNKIIAFVTRDIINPVIAIHDLYDNKARINKYINRLYYDYGFKGGSEYVCLFNKDPFPIDSFRKFKNRISRHCNEHNGDWKKWLEIL